MTPLALVDHHRGHVRVLLFDVLVIGRRPHEPSRREVVTAPGLLRRLAVLFGIGVWFFAGAQYGGEFFAGWLTEYSLSIDNLFIFIIIMAKLPCPRQYQQTALLIGIVLALVMRGIFIAVGAAAITSSAGSSTSSARSSSDTAVKLRARPATTRAEYDEPRLVRFARAAPAGHRRRGTAPS